MPLPAGTLPRADSWPKTPCRHAALSNPPLPPCHPTLHPLHTHTPQGDLDLSSDPWPNISDDAKDCVKRMLEPSPARRATADEILQHPWMRENGVASDAPLDNVILRRMT